MPPVYKTYSQSELDRQYNNRLQTPNFAFYLERYESASGEVENTIHFEKDIAYGINPRETLDVYPGKDPNAPVVVFIHGGYWRSFDKSSFRFVAPLFLPTGVNVICINYPLAPSASMDEIVTSCEKAISWITEKYKGKLYLLGHSAGAHLAAMILTRSIGSKVKGMASLSGIFNLIPIQKSDLNDSLKMDESMAKSISPVMLKPVHPVPIFLAVGAEETDEFKAQTDEMAKTWNGAVAMEIVNQNHFSIVDSNSSVYKDLINHWSLI